MTKQTKNRLSTLAIGLMLALASVLTLSWTVLTFRHQIQYASHSSRQNRLLMESIPDGVCWIDAETNVIQQVNPGFCRIMGRGSAELIGKDFVNFLPSVVQRRHRSYLHDLEATWETLARGRLHVPNAAARLPDGSFVVFSMYVWGLSWKGDRQWMCLVDPRDLRYMPADQWQPSREEENSGGSNKNR